MCAMQIRYKHDSLEAARIALMEAAVLAHDGLDLADVVRGAGRLSREVCC